ncbi:MAG: RND transporter, partial [Sphingomonas sp.]
MKIANISPAALLLLGGCAIPASPPAVAPVAPASLGLTGAAAPVVADDWWTGFGDPQLDRIVADATGGNPTLAAALARIAQAQAVLSSRRADTGPDVTLDANEQLQRLSGRYIIPPPYGGSVRFVGQTQANLTWNLDLFGRQKAAIEGARASARAAALDLAAARLAIAGSV